MIPGITSYYLKNPEGVSSQVNKSQSLLII